MTSQEQKQLLLRDLSTRLPYNVKCRVVWDDTSDRILTPVELFGFEMNAISEIKPYLRPMSSMTKDERLVYEQRLHDVGRSVDVIDADEVVSYIDWLNENRFDYRGLIPMGLALEAPDGMYK